MLQEVIESQCCTVVERVSGLWLQDLYHLRPFRLARASEGYRRAHGSDKFARYFLLTSNYRKKENQLFLKRGVSVGVLGFLFEGIWYEWFPKYLQPT